MKTRRTIILISFPENAVTKQDKREFLLAIVRFVESNSDLLKDSSGDIIEETENGLGSCAAILESCASILECTNESKGNRLTGSALMKLDFNRDYQLNSIIPRVYSKERKCKDVAEGFVTHSFPGSTNQYQNSTMANILKHLPHNKDLLGNKFQDWPISFFKRGYHMEKRLILYLSVPILTHERFCSKITLFVNTMSSWVEVFSSYDVSFLLITTKEINRTAFDTVRKDLETFGVLIHTVDLNKDVKSNQDILIKYLRGLNF